MNVRLNSHAAGSWIRASLSRSRDVHSRIQVTLRDSRAGTTSGCPGSRSSSPPAGSTMLTWATPSETFSNQMVRAVRNA